MTPPSWSASALACWALASGVLPSAAALTSDQSQLTARDFVETSYCRLDTQSTDELRQNPRLLLRVKPWAGHWRGASGFSPLPLDLSPLISLGTPDVCGLSSDTRWNQSHMHLYSTVVESSPWSEYSWELSSEGSIAAVDLEPPTSSPVETGAPDDDMWIRPKNPTGPSTPEIREPRPAPSARSPKPSDSGVFAKPSSDELACDSPSRSPAVAPARADSTPDPNDEGTPEPSLGNDDCESETGSRRRKSTHGAASPNREITAMGAGLISVMLIFVFCL